MRARAARGATSRPPDPPPGSDSGPGRDVRKSPLTIETGRGVLTLELEIAGGAVRQVRVDMGEPILRAERIPVLDDDGAWDGSNQSLAEAAVT